jgi:hypothetical protein
MFCTNRGLFEPLVMYFGLTNSPATFQTMMTDIFQDLILSGDIIEHRLFLRPEKCEFEKSMIEYLSVIISHNHVEMDPVKVTGDRPGIGAPGDLFKSARVATYYNVLHYITMSSHKG